MTNQQDDLPFDAMTMREAPLLTSKPPAHVAPYGGWTSSIGAEQLACAAIELSDLRVSSGDLYWRETRPADGGRHVLMQRASDGRVSERTPAGFSVRSRVHEYGGSSYLVLNDAIVFSNFSDQRLYLHRHGEMPQVLTPPDFRYADFVRHPTRAALVCVREDHTASTLKANGEQRNEIVMLDLPAAGAAVSIHPGHILVTGADFVAWPRLNRDGTSLAWLWWNHPNMPWDCAQVSIASLSGAEIGVATVVGGCERHAANEPQWDRDGTLYFLDEPDGWWNLFGWDGNGVRAVAPMLREFGGPLWRLGATSYALTGEGSAIVRSSCGGTDSIGLLNLSNGRLDQFDLPFVAFDDIQLMGPGVAVVIAHSAIAHSALVAIDLVSGSHDVLYQPAAATPDPALISRGEAIEFPTAAGPDGEPRTAHAFYYPPVNPGFVGPASERPPLLVMAHGGPTSSTTPALSLARQFWTSRGFAVVDLNYSGSSTFGRAYRQRLNGQWGVVDRADAVAVVDHLIASGRVDPQRIAIRGGSAGGYLVLAALAFTDRFNVGANYYGVADIQALSQSCHKFERCYDMSLVGPPNDALYRARSPLFHLDSFDAPLITFQGADDLIVTPDQSRRIFEALVERGVMTAYIEFAGEQHGFRIAGNIVRAIEAELFFYGQVLGFEPADALEPVEIIGSR